MPFSHPPLAEVPIYFHNSLEKKNPMSNTELKTTFNTASTLYEDIRPGYPEKLIEDVLDISGIENNSKILEVGCGTGKATRSFAERGYELVCLDIGADLIVVAREKLKEFPNVSFIEQAFEARKSEDKFNLVISATAFHWVDPNVRYLKASEVLRSGGSLAVFSNQHVRKEEGFFAESQSLYDQYYLPLTTNRPTHTTDFPGVEAFQDPIKRVYPWTQTYSSEQYIKLLGTYSGHIALPDENKRLLFEGITDLIETKYDGQITKHYKAVLDLRETQ
jgi:ubiquinone/menaquinone biosynthesis C-methylase UbiE